MTGMPTPRPLTGPADFIGAKAAILIGDRLLLTLRDDRPDIPCPNMWDMPGGGREPGETPEATMIRETQEEVGLDVAGQHPLWRRPFASVHHPGETVWFFVLRLPGASVHDIRLGDEGQGWRLITPAAYRHLPAAVPYLRDRFFAWFDALPEDPPFPAAAPQASVRGHDRKEFHD